MAPTERFLPSMDHLYLHSIRHKRYSSNDYNTFSLLSQPNDYNNNINDYRVDGARHLDVVCHAFCYYFIIL